MTTVGDYMMIMGGAKGGYFNTIERFDGDTWTPLSNNLTYGRKLHCSVAICSTEVLVIGGYFTSSYISAMEKNDINGNHIETLPSMELARSSSGCGVYNNEVYVTGGFNSTGLSSVEVYNILAKQWGKANNIKIFGGYDAVAKISMEVFYGINWIEDNTNLSKPFMEVDQF